MAIVLAQVKTHWNGTSGGPGITQMAFQSQTDPHSWDASAAQTAVNAVRAFWNTCQGLLPNNITLVVDPVVDVFNIADAGLVGSYTAATPPTSLTGLSTGAFSMAAGAKITLKTASVINRRRVHGGIFIVPAGGDLFDTDGVITSSNQATMVNAANTLRTTMLAANAGLCVWSRPRPAKGTKPSFTGQASDVTGFVVNSHGAILRGRRD